LCSFGRNRRRTFEKSCRHAVKDHGYKEGEIMTSEMQQNIKSHIKREFNLRHVFWKISDFGAKCEKCETINTITLEKGELKKQVWIPEEEPNFVINVLINFFGGGANLK
jgi:hypothetical protein